MRSSLSTPTNCKRNTMPALRKTSTAGTIFLLSFLPLLGTSAVRGASLREHRLRGSEPDDPYQPPNADMLKALEYIENLHQRSGAEPQLQMPPASEYDATDMDDSEKLRAMLRAASAPQSQAGEDDVEERAEEEKDNEEDKSQEWLQAVLSSLQQTEEASKPAAHRSDGTFPSPGKGGRTVTDEEDAAYHWTRQPPAARPHRNPLLEDDEEVDGDEGDEEEEEEGRALSHESPFKRMNENVEEKYTAQNLATLQSLFEELGRLANTKAASKRQTGDDNGDDMADEEGKEEDDDIFNVRDEDIAGGELWSPLEEQEREEEEEEAERDVRDVDQDLFFDDQGEDDDVYDERYPVKRSSHTGLGDDPEDFAKLADYYLLKVLEKTEEEEQKRELEEEKRAQRRAAQSQYSDNINPQAIYQLIQISQKLQIPPEDLLDMLKTGELTKQDRTPSRSQAQLRKDSNLARLENKLSPITSHKTHKSPPANVYNRRLPDTQTSNTPDDWQTEEILNILGLGSLGNQNMAPLKKQKHRKSSPSRLNTPPSWQEDYILPPEKLKDDYDDTVGEDEIAAYLAGQMLAQYPDYYNKVGQKRASDPNEAGQIALGSFEQMIQDYLDQMVSEKSPHQKRQSESEDMGDTDTTQAQSLDDEALRKILSYLNTEIDETVDKNVDDKSVKGL